MLTLYIQVLKAYLLSNSTWLGVLFTDLFFFKGFSSFRSTALQVIPMNRSEVLLFKGPRTSHPNGPLTRQSSIGSCHDGWDCLQLQRRCPEHAQIIITQREEWKNYSGRNHRNVINCSASGDICCVSLSFVFLFAMQSPLSSEFLFYGVLFIMLHVVWLWTSEALYWSLSSFDAVFHRNHQMAVWFIWLRIIGNVCLIRLFSGFYLMATVNVLCLEN